MKHILKSLYCILLLFLLLLKLMKSKKQKNIFTKDGICIGTLVRANIFEKLLRNHFKL